MAGILHYLSVGMMDTYSYSIYMHNHLVIICIHVFIMRQPSEISW